MINRKIPGCVRVACRRQSRCLFYSHSEYLVCQVHPKGVDSDRCLDFRPDSNAKEEELWSPEDYSWYGNELIANRPSRYTPEQQLGILDTHPFFTGVCPQCEYEFDKNNPPAVHWDCSECGWIDDAIH